MDLEHLEKLEDYLLGRISKSRPIKKSQTKRKIMEVHRTFGKKDRNACNEMKPSTMVNDDFRCNENKTSRREPNCNTNQHSAGHLTLNEKRDSLEDHCHFNWLTSLNASPNMIKPLSGLNHKENLLLDVFKDIYTKARKCEHRGLLFFAKHMILDGLEIMLGNQDDIRALEAKHFFYIQLHSFEDLLEEVEDELAFILGLKEKFVDVLLGSDSTYDNVFGHFLKKGRLTEVAIYEANLRTRQRLKRFLGFLEYLLGSSRHIKFIYINTGSDLVENGDSEIFRVLDRFEKPLKLEKSNCGLNQMIFNNGHIIQSFKGLDVFSVQTGCIQVFTFPTCTN